MFAYDLLFNTQQTEKRVKPAGRQRWCSSECSTPLIRPNPERDHLLNTLQKLALFKKRLSVISQLT